MRIDYSEPKRSSVTGQSKPKPRKEPTGLLAAMAIVGAVIIFIAGFGTGWFFSQKSAKKSFQAAMQQKSLENSPPEPAPIQAAKPQPAQGTAAQPQPPAATPQASAGGATTPEPPLSFYKTLPSGQKSNVLGSGVNTNDDKGKAPLQAPVPANLARPTPPAAEPPKPATDRQGQNDKATGNGFTVQVASYSLKSEAEGLRAKLAGKGYNVTIVESNQGDKGVWYRVRVGRKLEQEAAKELAGKIGKGAIVIPDKE